MNSTHFFSHNVTTIIKNPALIFFVISAVGYATNKKPDVKLGLFNAKLKYEIKGSTVTIFECDKKESRALIIPAVIEGKPVTSIRDNAFAGCHNITSIIIPATVTKIGNTAFIDCFRLRSITIPDSVTNIGDGAFYQCTNLTALTFLGDAPEIANDAFEKSSPTIYREAAAKGWGDTLAGRPVKLITEKP